MANIKPEEIAYIAGFFDGEGVSIFLKVRNSIFLL